jgi:TRAP transporter 4TM/12TM fusion protein
MTIPVIRKSGFRPSFAAAVEASASTGGQVMPPVMGIVAFFMAGQIGVEYRYIVVAAIVPALFFYLGLFLTVYFEARKCGVGRLKEPERAPLTRREMLQCLVFLLPLAAMSYSLFTQPSVQRAGFIGFGVAFITALMLFPGFRTPKAVAGAFIAAGKLSASIIAIVAAIGLIVGLIQLSGFSGRLSLVLTEMATGPQFTMLLVLAAGAIVLGMGLPPGATYFVIVIALSSGIDAMSLAPLTLHLFVVFFAVISTVTPPVALAAFAAAPIAGANPIRTGLEAARLSAAGFIIPFVFAYHPAVLYKLHAVFELFGSAPPSSRAMLPAQSLAWIDLVWVIAAFALAMWLIASATVGFDRRRLSSLQRLLRGAVGLMVLLPDKFLALIGAALALALLFGLPRWPRLRSPRAADKPPRGPTGRP